MAVTSQSRLLENETSLFHVYSFQLLTWKSSSVRHRGKKTKRKKRGKNEVWSSVGDQLPGVKPLALRILPHCMIVIILSGERGGHKTTSSRCKTMSVKALALSTDLTPLHDRNHPFGGEGWGQNQELEIQEKKTKSVKASVYYREPISQWNMTTLCSVNYRRSQMIQRCMQILHVETSQWLAVFYTTSRLLTARSQ